MVIFGAVFVVFAITALGLATYYNARDYGREHKGCPHKIEWDQKVVWYGEVRWAGSYIPAGHVTVQRVVRTTQLFGGYAERDGGEARTNSLGYFELVSSVSDEDENLIRVWKGKVGDQLLTEFDPGTNNPKMLLGSHRRVTILLRTPEQMAVKYSHVFTGRTHPVAGLGRPLNFDADQIDPATGRRYFLQIKGPLKELVRGMCNAEIKGFLGGTPSAREIEVTECSLIGIDEYELDEKMHFPIVGRVVRLQAQQVFVSPSGPRDVPQYYQDVGYFVGLEDHGRVVIAWLSRNQGKLLARSIGSIVAVNGELDVRRNYSYLVLKRVRWFQILLPPRGS